MAAYGNYQFASPPSGGAPTRGPYGQPPPPQQHYPQQQQPPAQNPNWQAASYAGPTPSLYGTAPPPGDYQRAPLQRSRSFDPAQSPHQASVTSRSLVAFDPYASTTSAPGEGAPPPGVYNNYALPPMQHGQHPPQFSYSQPQPPYLSPPTYNTEEMTTSPPSHFAFAQPPPTSNNFNPSSSTVSDISMFSSAPQQQQWQQPTTTTETALATQDNEFSESSIDPALVAEQERIWQEIQDRREMERIRGDGGVARPRAIIPHAGSQVSPYDGGSGRQLPPRTRSMPHPNGLKPKSSVHSLAHGGVAVLDPKKDKRKQTRKLKTATGAVGGAVVGGLILGPVGVVLGAGGGAAISNKVAKSRDKRKQSEFEQRNFQKGADHSVARQGDGAFA